MTISKRSQGQSRQGSGAPGALSSQKSQHVSPSNRFAQILSFQPLQFCCSVKQVGDWRWCGEGMFGRWIVRTGLSWGPELDPWNLCKNRLDGGESLWSQDWRDPWTAGLVYSGSSIPVNKQTNRIVMEKRPLKLTSDLHTHMQHPCTWVQSPLLPQIRIYLQSSPC